MLISEMLFADNAGLATHIEDALQCQSDRFTDACKPFGLTVSPKRIKVTTQGVSTASSILIDNVTLEAVDNFAYLGSIISNTLSLSVDLDRKLEKSNTIMARLSGCGRIGS